MGELNLKNALITFNSYSWYSSKLKKGLYQGKFIRAKKAETIMGDLYNDMIVYIIQMEDMIKQQEKLIDQMYLDSQYIVGGYK